MTKKKPHKLENVLVAIRDCIKEERYTLTVHALDRQEERRIEISEIIHVLKTGYEEKRKTCFDDKNNAWKYAIRGKTKNTNLDIRVIVAFDELGMLVITVMYIGGL